jgi:hypothetical protein
VASPRPRCRCRLYPTGPRRFVEWVTGLALNVEAHSVAQSLVGLDRADDWKALEEFAECGHRQLPLLEWHLATTFQRCGDSRW